GVANRAESMPPGTREPCTGPALPEPAGRCSTQFDPGVSLARLTDAERAQLRIHSPNDGLKLVDQVEGLPAARAGLLPGDVIVGLDGRPLARTDGTEVLRDVLNQARGRAVEIRILRAGKERLLTIDPAAAGQPSGRAAAGGLPLEPTRTI